MRSKVPQQQKNITSINFSKKILALKLRPHFMLDTLQLKFLALGLIALGNNGIIDRKKKYLEI